MKPLPLLLTLLAFSLSLHIYRPTAAQDMSLSMVLLDGEGWEVVSDGHDFTDATCTDAEGNFYFADVKSGTAINKIDAKGNLSQHIVEAPGVSGAQLGPDGRIYACQPRMKRVVAFTPPGKIDVLAENVQPNDLVVTRNGGVYFTETRAQQITHIDPEGNIHPTKTSITRPNGITLSRDQKTLAVSDHGGKHVWTYRIRPDGKLFNEQAYMTMRTPAGTEEAKGDGMITDAAGRYYATTALGIQMFDPHGRLSGIIPKPQDANLVSVAFGGPGLAYLHVACGDKIFRRKTRTKGLLFFLPPATGEKPKR